jgi:hypothetical protein
LTFANVVSLMALFVALSGGAYALTIPRNSVGAKQLKRNAVTRSKIRTGAVTSSKVKAGSLLAKNFKPGQLPAGPAGPPGAQGKQGTVDSSNFFTKSEGDARFLGIGATAANSSLLGGLGSSAFVQGNGARLLTTMLNEPNDGTTHVLFDIANAGKLSLQCTASSTNTLRLIYHNNGAAAQWRVAEQHDTQSSPNEFLGSVLVNANSDEASSYSFFGPNQGLPFRDVISVVPQSGTGTSLLFDVSGVINPSGFGCLAHGTATVLP